MSTIYGNPLLIGGGGNNGGLNITYSLTPPADTGKLWVRTGVEPEFVEVGGTFPIPLGEAITDIGYNPMLNRLQYYFQNNNVECLSKIYSFLITSGKFQIYDMATNLWSESAPLPASLGQSFNYAGYCVVGSKIYCFGGWNSSSTPLSQCVVYDTETDTWSKKSNAPDPGRWGYYYVFSDVIYMFAYRNNTVYLYDIKNDVYTIDTSNWSFNRSLDTNAYFSDKYCGIVSNNELYLIPTGSAISNYKSNCMIWKINIPEKTISQYNTMQRFLSNVTTDIPHNSQGAATVNVNGALYYISYISSYNDVVGNIIKITPSANGLSAKLLDIKAFTERFSASTFTISLAAGSLRNKIFVVRTCFSKTGASYNAANRNNSISLYSELEKGKLLFPIGNQNVVFVTNKSYKITVPTVTPALGNEQGIAEGVDAYLYDTTQQKWISLDGVPYTA